LHQNLCRFDPASRPAGIWRFTETP
jgi:hypothetical protein